MFNRTKSKPDDLAGEGALTGLRYSWTARKNMKRPDALYPYEMTITVADGTTIKYKTAANEKDAIHTAKQAVKQYLENLGKPYFIEGEGIL